MVQSSYKATFKRRWPGLYKIVWFIHRTIKPMWSWSELLELLDTSRTYYPEAEQKTNREILIDQLRWYLRHGEWLENYYYGLDRKSKSIDEVLRYAAFVRLRDAHNEKGLSYACVMDDKFLFERVAQSLGYPTPSNIALLEPARIEWLSPRHEAPLDSLLNHELDAILKPLHGAGGDGVATIKVSKGTLEINGGPSSLDDLKDHVGKNVERPMSDSVTSTRYVLQERLQQHEVMESLYPSSTNTVRLVTIRCEHGPPKLFHAALRVGAGGTVVDNWDSGGFIVAVDEKTGKTRTPGIFKPQKGPARCVKNHPDTGISLDGYEIPHFSEAAEKALQFHNDLDGLHSVGWDIAIIPNGISFIEGNRRWDGKFPMVLEDRFKHKLFGVYDGE